MKRDYIIDRFDGGMNRISNARDLANNEAEYLLGLVADIPGQLRTMGKESSQGKTFTGFQTVGGSGLFHTLVDRNRAGTEQETEWLLSPDKDTGIVSVLEYGAIGGAPSAGTWSNALSPTMDIGTTNCKGVFHSYDGVIRGCDGNFGGTPKWYGYIKRDRFTGSGADAWTDNGWVSESLLLAPPALFSLTATAGAVNLNSGLATGAIQANLESSHDADEYNYQWQKKIEGAISYVYDNNQESLLTESSNVLDLTVAAFSDMRWGSWGIHITGTEALLKAVLNKRITHIKLYIREQGTEEWYLQGVYDLESGGSLPYSDTGKVWNHINDGGNQYYYSRNVSAVGADYWMPDPLMGHTYISETGHSPDEKAIDIGYSGDGWKASVVLNRQVYLFYPRAKDKDGIQKKNGDMILVSEPGQPDKFLRDNALISTTGDADHLVFGLALDDRIFAFKQNSTRIINVAQETEIDDTVLEGIDGVDKAVLTDYGVIWVNKHGLFLYGRRGYQELFKKEIEGKPEPYVDLAWLDTNVLGAGYGIAYNRHKQQIIISGYASGDEMIIYDLASGSVSYGVARIPVLSSNFVEDIAGNTLFLVDSGANVLLYKFDFDETTYTNPKYYSKDIDFGFPYVNKYIYKVIVNYMHSHVTTMDNNVEMLLNGDTVSTPDRLVGSMPQQLTDFADAVYVMPASANYTSCKSMQLRIGGYDWIGSESDKDTKLRINHIIIVYRVLPNAR